jgi:hypothetical protein
MSNSYYVLLLNISLKESGNVLIKFTFVCACGKIEG